VFACLIFFGLVMGCLGWELDRSNSDEGFRGISSGNYSSSDSYALAQTSIATGTWCFLSIPFLILIGCNWNRGPKWHMAFVWLVAPFVAMAVTFIVCFSVDATRDERDNYHGLWSEERGERFLVVILTNIGIGGTGFFFLASVVFYRLGVTREHYQELKEEEEEASRGTSSRSRRRPAKRPQAGHHHKKQRMSDEERNELSEDVDSLDFDSESSSSSSSASEEHSGEEE
jgi:hypothetical protein